MVFPSSHTPLFVSTVVLRRGTGAYSPEASLVEPGVLAAAAAPLSDRCLVWVCREEGLSLEGRSRESLRLPVEGRVKFVCPSSLWATCRKLPDVPDLLGVREAPGRDEPSELRTLGEGGGTARSLGDE